MPGEAARSQWTPEAWRHARELLATLIELPKEERSGFLDSSCGEDVHLRCQLEDLLRAHEDTSASHLDRLDFIDDFEVGSVTFIDSVVGRRIGAYQVEGEIAHGGMGTVYRAVRADDTYQKRVAIKLVDRRMLSRRSAELFRHERQILANLEHPNIARLLDGGTHEDGSPYLVMEYVEGEVITKYCDSHHLSIEERLALFQKICSAVHFAHQNLVIHRDVKPANILVTREGEPKLLDFGIAKIAGSGAETQTMGAMTPAYASPEQLSGVAVTTSTDIYSLGLVLYEILTGRYAYERFTSPVQRQRAILESDPERPSQVILHANSEGGQANRSEGISALRKLPVEKLSKRLAGDLESIVAKAIRKEPVQRYSSVAQFSEDISRHLRGEPVIAHQGTFIYRCNKFIRRHRFGVVTGFAILALVFTGLVLIVQAERRARAQQVIAEQRFNDVRKLANSLIFEVHDSIRNLPGATTARKLIAQRAQEYLDSLASQKSSDPALLSELAGAYRRLASVLGNSLDANSGNSDRALQDYRRALELRKSIVKLRPSDVQAHCDLAQSYLDVALLSAATGADNPRDDYLNKAISILEPLASSNPQNAKVQYGLAKALERKAGSLADAGKLDEAKADYERTLVMYKQLMNTDPKNDDYRTEVSFAHKHLGGLLATQHAPEQLRAGFEQYKQALALDEELLKANPQDGNRRYAITFTYSDMGYILGKLGNIDEAVGYYTKVFQIRSALVAADPQDTRARSGLANTYHYLAGLHTKQEKIKAALDDEEHSFQIRKILSDADPSNEAKRLSAAWSQASVAQASARLAFAPHAKQQQALCREASESYKQAIPVLLRHKSEFIRDDSAYLDELQHVVARCDAIFRNVPVQSAGDRKSH